MSFFQHSLCILHCKFEFFKIKSSRIVCVGLQHVLPELLLLHRLPAILWKNQKIFTVFISIWNCLQRYLHANLSSWIIQLWHKVRKILLSYHGGNLLIVVDVNLLEHVIEVVVGNWIVLSNSPYTPSGIPQVSNNVLNIESNYSSLNLISFGSTGTAQMNCILHHMYLQFKTKPWCKETGNYTNQLFALRFTCLGLNCPRASGLLLIIYSRLSFPIVSLVLSVYLPETHLIPRDLFLFSQVAATLIGHLPMKCVKLFYGFCWQKISNLPFAFQSSNFI